MIDFWMALRENQLTLFDSDGSNSSLDRETHLTDCGEWMDWTTKEARIEAEIQLSLGMWASWEVHIARSAYSVRHFEARHIEDDWLHDLNRLPPCAVMKSMPIRVEGERIERFPVRVEWRAQDVLGPEVCCSSVFEDEGHKRKAWRFYLKGAWQNR